MSLPARPGAPLRVPGRVEYLARTLRGLEPFAAREVAARLRPLALALDHRELRFALPAADPAVTDLGTVDDVFAVLARSTPIGRGRGSLNELRQLAARVPAFVVTRAAADTVSSQPFSFDVTASFRGRRSVNRHALEDAVGEALAAMHGWRYRSRRGDVRVGPTDASLRLHATPADTTLALRVAARPLHRRAYRVATRPGALHPPLARVAALAAELRPGQRVLDPMCGGGTLAIEAALALPGLRVRGFDLDAEAVAVARSAARRAGSGARFEQADAADLPVPTASIAAALVNPPWGRTVAPRGALRSSYAPLAAELRRVLRGNGRVLLVEPPDGALATALARDGFATRRLAWARTAGTEVELTVAIRRR